ncbi:hypothetical protein PHMEG_00034893 [Phytophthora megakarya]|uniref:Uncharacterized protein n=1 Tax=Phytophthora megakarya TaxID=4795 RepID=A0A225UQE0_9STRA|nr:hypothetical protein PHMEG_00034893 [Phytophthora megakarya]
MAFSTFEELPCIMDYYQSLRRSKGIPPPPPATMLQCALSCLAGGSYHHIRVITGVSTATFNRIIIVSAVNMVSLKIALGFSMVGFDQYVPLGKMSADE